MIQQKHFEKEWAGRKLIIETGRFAPQANGSCTVQYGDTLVQATAVMSPTVKEGMNFFPLTVEYEEKMYAAGKIKGSRFIKREGRPTDEAILTARLVDRAIRPLFDDRIRNDIQVVLTVLSLDTDNDPDIIALIAASTALSISNIPWNGPIAGVNVSKIEDKLILNPTYEERAKASLYTTVAGTKEKVIMLEAEAKEAAEEEMSAAILFGQENLEPVIKLIQEIKKELGEEKISTDDLYAQQIKGDLAELKSLMEEAQKFLDERIEKYMFGEIKNTKQSRKEALRELKELLKTTLEEREVAADMINVIMAKADKLAELRISEAIVDRAKRVDGRQLDEIRPLFSEAGILPRVHGSGYFRRGETHVLSVVTLGAPGDEQVLDGMEMSGKKRYMHHYNFPPYSVGETGRMSGPGRREIGHGALAEKAIFPVLPEQDKFPYTIRVVSEVMSSNGSSSMASVCGSTLSLMDAGVPIKSPVAGIAMGLAVNSKGDWKVITDLQDLEDGYGGMDFKIAGTAKGITAIQMDTKSDGLLKDIVLQTLKQARVARLKVLDSITNVLPAPRAELSPYAPRIESFYINPDKIRDVIGPGGKMINKIIAETGVDIDIEDSGLVSVTSADKDGLEKAVKWIRDLTAEAEMGKLYTGKVTRIMDFGALVEILPGQEGMVHISELAPYRVARVEDVIKLGQEITVKVINIDKEAGKIGLSLKRAQPDSGPDEPEEKKFGIFKKRSERR
ncbi:MAG: polyribonucleotide nucleotidyltransferase [Patescibacteria group bacterium]|nr:polyribonucleotide nucleotidyltransferase [Patescibacteria group bacterium]MDD5490814.1 polyribonucleotide nucleotidyltransferase [Patescibacteria group bacterium]